LKKQISKQPRHLKKYHKKIVNLKNQKSPKSSAELLEEFSSMDVDGRIRFLSALYSFEPSLLSLALADKSKDVRTAAVKFISYIPENQIDISPFLITALDDESQEVRETAQDVMDSVNDRNTVLKIIKISTKSKYPDTRLKCVLWFADLGVSKENLKDMILKALEDDNKNVRDAALEAASALWEKEFSSEKDAKEFIASH
jgi:hypothetical protein